MAGGGRALLLPDGDPAARAIEPFAGRLVGHELPSIDVVRVTATPNDCLRTPAAIAARDPEQLQLHVLRRGRCEVSQDDRRTS